MGKDPRILMKAITWSGHVETNVGQYEELSHLIRFSWCSFH